ncbi:DUF2254 family protein [Egicoccus halophilus]|uniref:DUF2254 domain-containing protein n=1 Tax=Egicoccus halophilus TaxID=1670830 RepID=A0A8J3AGT7_9ACTN|nr:DUF2254 family protein [Egicoccus halophilus]GGI08106.1 hypothetical protein GCM10011354_27440 [Egicoccus halophilus]
MQLVRDDGRLRTFALLLSLRSLAGMTAGVLVALGVAWLDRLVGVRIPVAPETAQGVLASFVGGVLTIAVFALWMRTVVVGLASSQVSSRVLAAYLDDRFQRQVLGVMVGMLAYLVATVVVYPDTGEGVPLLLSSLSAAVVVAALIGVLLAMRHAVGSLSVPSVVRTLTDQVLELLADPPWPNEAGTAEVPDPDAPGTTVTSRDLGWVQRIDHRALIDALPAGATLVLHADVGEFVAEGETIGHLDVDVEPPVVDAVLAAFRLERTRSNRRDLAYAVQQLVDVAQHAMAPHSADTSSAHEALVHLRAVLHLLLRRGTASGCLRGEDGRTVVSPTAWAPADHLRSVFDRLNAGASTDPVSRRAVVRTLGLLEATAREVGDQASVDVLVEHQERIPTADAPPTPAPGPDGGAAS